MSPILVPVDFSPVTSRVVDVAMQLASWESAEIVLLHATEIPIVAGPTGLATTWSKRSFRAAERFATDELRRLARHASRQGLGVRWVHVTGRPAEAILDTARREAAQCIVIGSHGHGALYELFAGSTTQSVLQRAGCPVVVVPDRGEGADVRRVSSRPTTILAALDAGNAASTVCDAAAALAQKAGGRLVLLHAKVPPAVELPPVGFAVREVHTMLRELEVRATRRARRLLYRCRRFGLPAQLIEKRSVAAPCIVAQARARRAAYIVMGLHPHGAAYDLLVGSTGQQVVRSAPCPVMLVPRLGRPHRAPQLTAPYSRRARRAKKATSKSEAR